MNATAIRISVGINTNEGQHALVATSVKNPTSGQISSTTVAPSFFAVHFPWKSGFLAGMPAKHLAMSRELQALVRVGWDTDAEAERGQEKPATWLKLREERNSRVVITILLIGSIT